MFDLLILAAGAGRRMGASTPKSIMPINGETPLTRLLRQAQDSSVRSATVIARSEDAPSLAEMCRAYEFARVDSVQVPGLAAGNTLCDFIPAARSRQLCIAYADTWFTENPFHAALITSSMCVAGGTSLSRYSNPGWIAQVRDFVEIQYDSTQRPGELAWPGLWSCAKDVEIPRHEAGQRVLVEDLLSGLSRRIGWRTCNVGDFVNLNKPEDLQAVPTSDGST